MLNYLKFSHKEISMMLEKNKIAVEKKMITGKKVSYTIDSDVVDEFNKLAKNRGYNKQKTVENLLKVFIKSETTKV